jgi:hypothetical protein
VAQPFDRKTSLPPAGSLDKAAGQFWVGHPWAIVTERKNLSAYERNRAFLNLGSSRFVDISFLTATDSDGDGRSAVAADLNSDGMLDLVVRQAGGGPLLVFLNRFPAQHYLHVSLRGTKSNGLGVGARLTAEVAGRRIVRDMFPANAFVSQTPHQVHFGLGQAAHVDRLTIRWPSGQLQELANVPADQHLYVREGDGDGL